MPVKNGFKEIRFKIHENPFQTYQEMALYFLDKKVIDKPTIHEYARWCMKYITDNYAVNMFHWKLVRSQQEQVNRNTMFGNQQESSHVQNGPVLY